MSVLCLGVQSLAAEPKKSMAGSNGIPIQIKIDKPGYTTVVIEREDGTRVWNLISETMLPAGEHNFTWDGYDVGYQTNTPEPYLRNLAGPGKYRVRGLTHDGIKMVYEFSVYSPGVTPWKNEAGTGSWLGDHSVSADCLFLPAGSGPTKWPIAQMLLGTATAEAGTGIAWTDLDAKKLGGMGWGWDGAFALARDAGSKANPKTYAYALNFGVLRVLSKDGGSEEVYRWTPERIWPAMSDIWSFVDVAVQDNIAIIANSDNRDNVDTISGNLLVVDVATKKALNNFPTGPTRGIAFGPDGKLYAVVGQDVRRFQLDSTTGKLTDEGAVLTGLEEPRRVRFDSTGNLYVGVWGKSHQILMYDPQLKLLRTIGKPGGPQVGPYDEQRMDRPEGFGVDERGVLWVGENSHFPKRQSLWDTKTGAFVKGIYGRPQYGGGGMIDPRDKTIFYFPNLVPASEKGVMQFKLDWETGEAKLVSIPLRTTLVSRQDAQHFTRDPNDVPKTEPHQLMPDYDKPFQDTFVTSPPTWAIYGGGQKFLYSQGVPRHGYSDVAMMWNADGELLKPVAAFGFAHSLVAGNFPLARSARHFEQIKQHFGEDFDKLGFVWSDENADQIIDPKEIQLIPIDPKLPRVMGISVEPDLAVTFLNLTNGRLTAPTFNDKGIPVWDVNKIQSVAAQGGMNFHNEAGVPLVGKENVVLSMYGWEHYTPIQGYARGGGLQWTYRTYPEFAVPQVPGQIAMGYLTGGPVVEPKTGEAGEMWMTSGSKGSNYLLTMDGLFLKTLGGDIRTTPLWRANEAKRGMIIDGVSFEDEAFQNYIQQMTDGTIYLVVGKEHSSICRLEGLETVKRHDWGTFVVTPDQLAGLEEQRVESPRTQMRKQLDVFMGGQAPKVDGDLTDWALPQSAWADIEGRQAAVRIIGDKVYAAYKTEDPTLLQNMTSDPRFAFKTGGGLDLYLGLNYNVGSMRLLPDAGDRRLFVTRIDGKITAILYRPVSPDAKASEKIVFESPIGKEAFDSVIDVSDSLEFGQVGGDYEYSIPLAVLTGVPSLEKFGHQIHHNEDRYVLGDLGIIRGNGQQNTQRLAWNNIDTAMTSDAPTESRMRPMTWGAWHLPPITAIQDGELEPLAETADKKERGLAYDYFEFEPEAFQDSAWTKQKPVSSGVVERPNVTVRKRNANIGLQFSGFINVPTDGWYRFDPWGSHKIKLTIGDRVVVSIDKQNSGVPVDLERYGFVKLQAGLHPISIKQSRAGSGPDPSLELRWSGPGIVNQVVPTDAFSH